MRPSRMMLVLLGLLLAAPATPRAQTPSTPAEPRDRGPRGPGPGGPDGDPGPLFLFQEVDANDDGFVTREELTRAASELFDQFAAAARDTDGRLSTEEFLAAVPVIFDHEGPPGMHEGPGGPGGGDPRGGGGHGGGYGGDQGAGGPGGGPPDPRAMFQHLDRDGDGLLRPEDMPNTEGRQGLEVWLSRYGNGATGVDLEQFTAFVVMTQRPGGGDALRPEYPMGGDGQPGGRPPGTRGGPGGPPGSATPGDPGPMSMERRFALADANDDGVLTLDEVEPHERDNFRFMLQAHGHEEGEGLTLEEYVGGLPERHWERNGSAEIQEQLEPKEPSEPGATPLTLE